MSTVADHLRAHEIPGVVGFAKIAPGMVRAKVTTRLASAEFLLHGAHMLAWQPADCPPILFLSRKSFFAPGKAVRGGVPVIFPWFGARAGDAAAPMHGFARTLPWELESIAQLPNETALAILRLTSSERTRAQWPHDFLLRLKLSIGRELELTLEVENTSTAAFAFEAALHSYFAVQDVRAVELRGLEHAPYLDKTAAFARKNQGAEPIRIVQETDRIFPDSRATCVIDDPAAARRVSIEKSGSLTTVVWNPWIAKAAAMPDFGDDEWTKMLCVETANVGPNAVTLRPGERHEMRARILIL